MPPWPPLDVLLTGPAVSLGRRRLSRPPWLAQRRSYRLLRHRKCAEFWSAKFTSAFSPRKQRVRCGGKCSCLFDVPQGSVLGPIHFIIYTADLAPLVDEYGLSLHQYADDSQIYSSCRPAATSTLSSDITECVDDISSCCLLYTSPSPRD